MRRKGLILSLISVILAFALLTGCNASTSSTPSSTINKPKPSSVMLDDYEEAHQSDTWISPGKVNIGNYYPGAKAEWNIRVHNGESWFIENKQVTTDPGETDAPIPLKKQLYGDPSEVIFTSNNPKDNLKALDYDQNKGLMISGFAPGSTRIMSIKYEHYKAYNIGFALPESNTGDFVDAPVEAEDWIIIAEPSLILAPRETREVTIAVSMPKESKSPPKWEFWIIMMEDNLAATVNVRLASRWQVSMRS